MNIIEIFQDLVAHVPDLMQPLIVAAAGAVPFVEGEGAVTLGIFGGVHPVIAAVSAMAGNFICVAVLVFLSSGARRAVVARRQGVVLAGAGAGAGSVGMATNEVSVEEDAGDRKSARRAKFQRSFERYGVPGVSLLGPLLLPTQFTATMLAAAGIGRARILIWQAVAIIGWTTAVAVIVGGAVYVVG